MIDFQNTSQQWKMDVDINVQACAQVHVLDNVDTGCLHLSLSTLVFETESINELGAHRLT